MFLRNGKYVLIVWCLTLHICQKHYVIMFKNMCGVLDWNVFIRKCGDVCGLGSLSFLDFSSSLKKVMIKIYSHSLYCLKWLQEYIKYKIYFVVYRISPNPAIFNWFCMWFLPLKFSAIFIGSLQCPENIQLGLAGFVFVPDWCLGFLNEWLKQIHLVFWGGGPVYFKDSEKSTDMYYKSLLAPKNIKQLD